MRPGYCIILAILLSFGHGVSGVESVEQTLGGITLGSSNVKDVRSKYGESKETDANESLSVLLYRMAGSCELTFVQTKTVRTITSATLTALGTGEVDPACTRIQTGAGLRLGDSLTRVKELYGSPHLQLQERRGNYLIYDDQERCCKGKQDTTEVSIHSLMIWFDKAGRVQEISLSADRLLCSEIKS